MTLSGIEPATFRLVAQRLNQLRHQQRAPLNMCNVQKFYSNADRTLTVTSSALQYRTSDGHFQCTAIPHFRRSLPVHCNTAFQKVSFLVTFLWFFQDVEFMTHQLSCHSTLHSHIYLGPVVTTCTTSFNVRKRCIISTQYIYDSHTHTHTHTHKILP